MLRIRDLLRDEFLRLSHVSMWRSWHRYLGNEVKSSLLRSTPNVAKKFDDTVIGSNKAIFSSSGDSSNDRFISSASFISLKLPYLLLISCSSTLRIKNSD